MRIKCPHCNGKGFSEINSALNLTCGWCMGEGELDLEIVPTEQTTNEDWLRSCTTEQLAESLLNIMANNEFTLYLLHTEKKSVQELKDAVVVWLKQPHQ